MPKKQDLANAIRALSMDAVQRANSGHPGMPMGMADIAQVLWNDFLVHNPANPRWMGRDRFVLSNGHGSMLLYSLLHLTGYAVSIDDVKNFRQLHSNTPGHPEFNDTPGVETTTGPLGQGLANAVGMAIAETQLAAQFNKDNFNLVNHFTYVFLGDGCLMEGVSHEACSLAGTLKLGKLIAFWDDNDISIDGNVSGWFTDNTPARFEAYDWHVIADVDGHDPEAIHAAIEDARAVTDKPSMICCKTTIGKGAPSVAGTAKAHGAPLGDDEIALARKTLGWTHAPFEIPADIYAGYDAKTKGAASEAAWNALFEQYQAAHPELANEFTRRTQGKLPDDWQSVADDFVLATTSEQNPQATRKSSLACIKTLTKSLPELVGGSADLSGSNLTQWPDATTYSATSPAGNYINYGVREFGMSAIANGIALHGGFIPFVGTFLVFSDYARNAIRLSAIMKQKVAYVFTHDSIGLGEDGPTHQPIEHFASLRLIPNLSVWRPCDLTESAVAWRHAVEHQGPTSLLFSRQNLAQQNTSGRKTTDIAKGGYVLLDCEDTPDIILIATGSEVELAVQAAKELASLNVRVVSMPSCDTFDAQEASYREAVLPSAVTARVAIEAGSTNFWYKYVGLQGKVVGIDRFGVSAPAEDAFNLLGFSVTNIINIVKTVAQTSSALT